MTTINISLPDDMRTFIKDEIICEGYASASEYFRDLVRQANGGRQNWNSRPSSRRGCNTRRQR